MKVNITGIIINAEYSTKKNTGDVEMKFLH